MYTSRNFYYYGQETGNSCGPACVRMALRNITGINYSEAVVRKGCNMSDTGTAIGNLKFYINSMQSYNSYVVRVGMDKETMKFNLYSGIVNWDAPPIIGVDENSKKGWNFNLGGHYVIAYAVSSDKKYFMISDPWAGYVGQAEKRDLKISVDDLYTGYIAVQIGYLF
ncbi:MAG: C39 family peptidase [Oscillospiraceae bacterium]|nr:C39 family peptidase [Oscillospiraceae bacterium]